MSKTVVAQNTSFTGNTSYLSLIVFQFNNVIGINKKKRYENIYISTLIKVRHLGVILNSQLLSLPTKYHSSDAYPLFDEQLFTFSFLWAEFLAVMPL